MATREEKFQAWYHGPKALEISSRDYDGQLGAAQRMIEDLLRSAYDAGYEDCLASVRDQLQALGATPSAADSAGNSETAIGSER